MTSPDPHQVTRLLSEWADTGDTAALDQATALLYSDLRNVARNCFRGERGGHTLQATALLNEAYLRLINLDGLRFENRRQFLALLTQIMRRVLVDHARLIHAAKRGSAPERVELRDVPAPDAAGDYLLLDDALTRLATMNSRQAQVIELRYFAGLGVVETGELLDISPATVSRDQRVAEAWLNRFLGSSPIRVLPA